MGKQRDPKRDEAFNIYKASGGDINLNVIAAQLELGDGTVRGWKSKDNWEAAINPNSIKSSSKSVKPIKAIEIKSEDDLYETAVEIVRQVNQASTSLLQRRLRIGLTRATRLMDDMERNFVIGARDGLKPRTVYLIDKPDKGNVERNVQKETQRNAPKKSTERSILKERSVIDIEFTQVDEEIENEIEDEDGLTPKRRLFVKYYLINFNATQAAIKAGYSKRSARDIGYELLTKPDIKEAIRRYTNEITLEIGFNAQRILMEYLKIAFADVTDYVDFGQKEVPVMTMFGPLTEGEDKIPVMKIVNYVSFKESNEVDGSLISEVKQGKDGASIKLHDKTKALDILAKYIDLLPDHHKRMVDNERLRIEQERLELDKLKAAGEGDLDEDLIDDWVGAVLDDGNEQEGKDQEVFGIQEETANLPEGSSII